MNTYTVNIVSFTKFTPQGYDKPVMQIVTESGHVFHSNFVQFVKRGKQTIRVTDKKNALGYRMFSIPKPAKRPLTSTEKFMRVEMQGGMTDEEREVAGM